MTDLREKLAEVICENRAVDNTFALPCDYDLADAIIAALPGMVPEFDEDDRTKIINTAHANFRRYGLGVRGQVITEWDSIESHVVEATRAAIIHELGERA